MFIFRRKIKEATKDLIQVKTNYHCIGYKEYSHEVSVKMTFNDTNLQDFLLDHSYNEGFV